VAELLYFGKLVIEIKIFSFSILNFSLIFIQARPLVASVQSNREKKYH